MFTPTENLVRGGGDRPHTGSGLTKEFLARGPKKDSPKVSHGEKCSCFRANAGKKIVIRREKGERP